jgi:hypothetical protein
VCVLSGEAKEHQHLTSLDLSDLEIITSTKDGFVTAVMKPIGDQDTPSLVV